MKQRVRAALERAGLRDQGLLVAASGGVDSSVLLYLLALLAPELRVSLWVGHVHHGLRDEADADAASVHGLAGQLGLPSVEERIDPHALRSDAPSSRARPTLQEASRRLRYEALAAMAQRVGARVVATAHHRDDQVETVMLRVLRGTSLDGLGGMRERAPWPWAIGEGPTLEIVRPLLDVARDEIVEFASSHGVSWREDVSNRDPRYARNRLREHWLPGLRESFNPQLDRAVADLARSSREEREWLQGLEAAEAASRFETLDDGSLRIGIEGWDELPAALTRRLARRALEQMGAGRDVSGRHLDRMLDFLHSGRGGARLQLPNGLQLRRESPDFRLERLPVPPAGGC